MERHGTLLEKEKSLLGMKAVCDSLTQRRIKAETNIRKAESNAEKLKAEADRLTRTQIVPLEADLAREEELEQAHKDYETSGVKLTELEAKKPEYDKWQAVVTDAERNLGELEQKHDTAVRVLYQRMETLRKKVELLPAEP